MPPTNPNPEVNWQDNTEAVQAALQDNAYSPSEVEELATDAYHGISDYQRAELKTNQELENTDVETEAPGVISEQEAIDGSREVMGHLNALALERGQSLHAMLADPAFADRVLSGETAGMDPRDRVRLIGLIATVAKPEGREYSDETIMRKQGETPQERAWRKAVNSLRSFAEEPKPSTIEAASEDPVRSEQLTNRVRAAAQARFWLANISADRPTGSTEEGIAASVEASTAIDLADFIQIPLHLLPFEALPPGASPTGGHIGTPSREGLSPILYDLDPTRMAVIRQLIDKFPDKNGRAYLSSKETRDGELHRSMILITVFDIDEARRVAVVERPAGHVKNNASALFIIDERNTAGTWQEIVALPRKEAASVGAHRIVHAGDWQPRVINELETLLA